MIGFIGSVFSPYYVWSRTRDPNDHCALNVAPYGERQHLWSMTERRRGAVTAAAKELVIGPSAMQWDGNALTITIDEVAAPVPRRIPRHRALHARCVHVATL